MYVLDVELQQVKFGWCFEFEMLEVCVGYSCCWLQDLKTASKLRMILKKLSDSKKKV